MELKDKVAIVTGASRGIGEAIAWSLAEGGAQVVLSSRKADGLVEVQKRMVDAGHEAFVHACHSGDPEQIDGLLKGAIERYGKIDVLVNNAATNPYFGPMIGVEWAAWDKTFDVNVRGYFAAARGVAQHLLDRKAPGSIINVSSVLGIRAGRLQGVYAMTKAAVISMTKSLAVELGPNQIRVNAVAPGFIRTRFSSALTENEGIRDMIVGRTPLGRLGAPEDIAPLVRYLASDASSFVTGATFVMDGGLTLE